jgi:hypothetical protein
MRFPNVEVISAHEKEWNEVNPGLLKLTIPAQAMKALDPANSAAPAAVTERKDPSNTYSPVDGSNVGGASVGRDGR